MSQSFALECLKLAYTYKDKDDSKNEDIYEIALRIYSFCSDPYGYVKEIRTTKLQASGE